MNGKEIVIFFIQKYTFLFVFFTAFLTFLPRLFQLIYTFSYCFYFGKVGCHFNKQKENEMKLHSS